MTHIDGRECRSLGALGVFNELDIECEAEIACERGSLVDLLQFEDPREERGNGGMIDDLGEDVSSFDQRADEQAWDAKAELIEAVGGELFTFDRGRRLAIKESAVLIIEYEHQRALPLRRLAKRFVD